MSGYRPRPMEGLCQSTGYRPRPLYLANIGTRGRRSPNSILNDIVCRNTMTSWLLQATKVFPPIKPSDFCSFVMDHLHYKINETNGRLWMKDLGFTLTNSSRLSIYHDGQQQTDVKCALKAYVRKMIDDSAQTVSYTGKKI